ncbi:hypothetical protein DFH07DRAFT_354803 [Mycena maculata]|uniref:Aminoglycoside phosphotransferase domain-containing protein n=1 Tax=Mycena maculata TaxID=230809 RepID=A0AAD7HB08_9AGAR|nr:hypothetical protein DFH07DRAFT_354803 [Mycena maculata]
MPSSTHGFLANEYLPSEEVIIARCRQVGFTASGTTLLDQSSQSVIAWIKYGPNVTISEALTQDWTAKALDGTPACGLQVPRVFHAFTRENPSCTIGYIAMQFIDAPDCESGDVLQVATAVQTLIDLPAPGATLGHIGGESIVHSFFLDWIPVADYKSVQDLNDHINNILKYMKDPRRVDLVADAKSGLCLCPCDIQPRNFKKRQDGQLFALDFRATCFMPRSFVGVAMKKSQDTFGRRVAKQISYPLSDDVSAMLSVFNFLVPFGQNEVAFPQGLQRKAI